MHKNKLKFVKIAVVSLLISSFLSFVILIFAYATSDFSVINVYQNSHSTKPLFYKISAVWGNHEGSMLLWILVITTLTFVAMVQLESVFYFDPKIKKAILIGLSVIFLLITIYWVIYFYWANNNNIQRYNVESLASKLGSNIFSEKHDTVLNALQLETTHTTSEIRANPQSIRT